MFNRYADMSQLTGEPEEGWTKMECALLESDALPSDTRQNPKYTHTAKKLSAKRPCRMFFIGTRQSLCRPNRKNLKKIRKQFNFFN
jgi:hypothetical protein